MYDETHEGSHHHYLPYLGTNFIPNVIISHQNPHQWLLYGCYKLKKTFMSLSLPHSKNRFGMSKCQWPSNSPRRPWWHWPHWGWSARSPQIRARLPPVHLPQRSSAAPPGGPRRLRHAAHDAPCIWLSPENKMLRKWGCGMMWAWSRQCELMWIETVNIYIYI